VVKDYKKKKLNENTKNVKNTYFLKSLHLKLRFKGQTAKYNDKKRKKLNDDLSFKERVMSLSDIYARVFGFFAFNFLEERKKRKSLIDVYELIR
jgi:hypothetical protein